MISKIVWPIHDFDPNPFGGAKGIRSLSLTFQSRVEDGISEKENRALEILHELVVLHEINVAYFDRSHYPQILFVPSKLVDDCTVKIVDNSGKLLFLETPIPAAFMIKRLVMEFMGLYNSGREQEFLVNRDDLLEAEAHHALCRDIFVTTSKFLIANRESLEELNIRTPTEALKIVGLHIRVKNEYEWISEVRGIAFFITSNQKFYWFLARAKLSNYWLFAASLNQYSERESLSDLGLSVHDRCEKALWARDEIAKLFYRLEIRNSDSRPAYHFDYLTLLLAGAFDSLALIINSVYILGLDSVDCSFNRKKFKEKVQKDTRTRGLAIFLSDIKVASFIGVLHKLRNKIHSISLKDEITVPETDTVEIVYDLYSYDTESHFGITKQRVDVLKNDGSLIPSYKIKIDKYTLAYQLIEESFRLIDIILELITPPNTEKKLDLEMIRQLERCDFLG